MKEKRFEIVYKQGLTDIVRIIVDTETGVQYLAMTNGYAGGMTVLLDRNGKPLLAPLSSGEFPEY